MRYKFTLFLIFLLGFILCFYKLGYDPVSMDWDEVSLGYNAYSILKTGRDEYGNFMPLQFRSFGDYKPPLYVYLTVPIVKIFGLTDFATRLPSAVAGFLTVVVVYFLIGELFPLIGKKYRLLGTFIFAISPWHLQFSRVAFEANVGLFWFTFGTYLFLKAQNNKLFYIFSSLSFVLSIYSYHSLRLISPIFVIGLSVLYLNNILKNKKIVIISGILTVFLLLPLVFLLKEGVGVASRFSSVSNATPEALAESIKRMEYDIQREDKLGVVLNNRRVVYFFNTVKGYFDHWNPSFLFTQGDPPGRHHAPDMGMLYFIELPLVLIGFYSLIFDFKNRGKYVLLLWFFIAPIASALTTGTPHAVRALFFLPAYQIITMLGIRKIYSLSFLTPLLVFLYTVSIYYYLDMYYIQSPIEQAADWQYGYKQVVDSINDVKTGNEKVIVTYRYDQPYIFFLFYNKIDPTWYQSQWQGGEIERFNRSFGDYVFRNIDWEQDQNIQNTILVGTPGEIPVTANSMIKEIKYPNGEVAFRIVKLK